MLFSSWLIAENLFHLLYEILFVTIQNFRGRIDLLFEYLQNGLGNFGSPFIVYDL